MGAHAILLVRARKTTTTTTTTSNNIKTFTILLILLLCLPMCFSLNNDTQTDTEALLKFKGSLQNVISLSSWDPAINPRPPCTGNIPNWVGIFCINDTVWGFRLENMGLTGTINIESLLPMRHLRSISLMNNTFVGPIPNIKLLKNLKSLYLSFNHFSGDIPDDMFLGMNLLKKVYLANNEFTGKIPSSLGILPNLLALKLEGNKFHGQIPNFVNRNNTLKKLDFSNNNLEGPIPVNLSYFNSSSFLGNELLCGKPLDKTCPITTNNGSSNSVFGILFFVFLALLIIVVIVSTIVISRLRSHQAKMREYSSEDSVPVFQSQASGKYVRPVYVKSKSMIEREKMQQQQKQHEKSDQTTTATATTSYSRKGEAGKLIFLRGEHKKFNLQDLLRASAEILGSASFGSSYKAVMKDNQAIVVKRYKHMNNMSREEFFEHMTRIGSLSHPNLLPLVAYYYRKEEKLLVSDFVQKGCLASQLHGNHNQEKPGLDWPTRLKIVKGIAKGLSYLYKALPSLVVPHGHLKSSNILLDESLEPLLTDYALIPVINLDHAQQIMMPYKSPEYAQLGRITRKTDVWSLGIVILEILTGKFPENYLTHRHDSNSDIASWVNTMITEKRTGEVFDVDMGRVENSKGELLKLLKIGLSCCEENVERRLDIKEALEKIQELKDCESDHRGHYSLIVTSEQDAFRPI